MHQNDVDLRSSKEVAALLGVTEACLITWRRNGHGPVYVRIGSRVAYDMRDVNAWLSARKCHGTAVLDQAVA